MKPTRRPTRRPTRKPVPSTCTRGFTYATYDAIEADIVQLKNGITDPRMRAHFLGGIVRLPAHDFMDYDPTAAIRMGADGCIEFSHSSNAGLASIWSVGTPLYDLHRTKYSWISKADFWVAAANAVLRQTSVNNLSTSYNLGYDLRSKFRWGRIDRATCAGSGARLAVPSRCAEVERVFRTQMGLSWTDAVALLGAHTLGRGSTNFSGHEGTWKDNDSAAQRFDKGYYEEMLDNNWRMRNRGGPGNGSPPQDWTTGGGVVQMMLNTDICLAYNVDDKINGELPLCTTKGEGSEETCPRYAIGTPRREALNAVLAFNNCVDDNDCFYIAFRNAWQKATVKGQSTATKQLTLTC